MDYVIFMLGALTTGFWLGVWATYVNFTKPLHEVEEKLRKELGEVRVELFGKEQALDRAGAGRFLPKLFGPGSVQYSVAHFELVEPTIEHRAPSDVFFFNSFEDLL